MTMIRSALVLSDEGDAFFQFAATATFVVFV